MANTRTDASIALSLKDNLSASIVGMKNSLSGFKTDVQGLQQQLDVLTATRYQLKNFDLKAAKSQVDEMRRAMEELGDTATETERQAARANFDEAVQNYGNVEQQLRLVSQQARQTERDLLDASDAISRMENRAGRSGGSGGGLIDSLGKAGAWSMAGDVLSQWADVWIGSATSGETGTLLSGALSGIGSGAAIGSMIAPGIGTAVGAVAGGLVGLASGAAQNFENEDEAFKSYVQTAAEGQMEARETSIASGSDTAAQRELDAIAFSKLLGADAADDYLSDLRHLAADTPMEYEDLTAMSRALATGFAGDMNRMLDLMTGIGNAGSAVGTDAGGMEAMAQALSRMESSNKATLEYLNIFQDRGVDVIGMLASALGTDQGGIYDMISKGSISGTQAVDIIQQGLDQYAGAMDEMARTFSGLTSTLSDAQTEMDNAYGEGYNETRKKGLQEEIDWLSGESGALMQEANRAIGAWQAELENLQEQYVREAVDAVLNSEEYQAAMAEGTDEGYAEAGRMLAEAKVRGMNEYNASEGAQLMLEYELALAEGIREDSVSNDAYWDAGYRKGQEYTKGLAAAMWANAGNEEVSSQQTEEPLRSVPDVTFPRLELQYTVDPAGSLNISGIKPVQSLTSKPSHAYGLDRVPYDNYTALLHQGERVLTASQAREMDRGGLAKGSINVNISGSWSVRSPEDVDEIAETIVRKIELAAKAGVNS